MPLTLTGTAADPTTSPQATGVADGDAGNSAGLFSGPLQPILNFISWLRTHIVPDTGGTFTGAVNGVTPTAAAHLARKDYVDTRGAKAWGVFIIAASGVVTIARSFNIASASWTTYQVTINFTNSLNASHLALPRYSKSGSALTREVSMNQRTATQDVIRKYVTATGADDNFAVDDIIDFIAYD